MYAYVSTLLIIFKCVWKESEIQVDFYSCKMIIVKYGLWNSDFSFVLKLN